MAMTPAMSQIFMISEDEYNGNRTPGDPGVLGSVMTPTQNINTDQYVPLGDGLLLLAGLGGAYLLGKRKKEE